MNFFRPVRYRSRSTRARPARWGALRTASAIFCATSVFGNSLSVTTTLALVSRRMAAICSGLQKRVDRVRDAATAPARSVHDRFPCNSAGHRRRCRFSLHPQRTEHVGGLG